jgi:hypothetical protein
MYLLVVVLNDQRKLEDVLSALLELDISGATIVDTEGMTQVLAAQVPIFAGLRQLVTEGRAYSKTIFALSPHKDIVDRMHALLKTTAIDFTEPGTGVLFSLAVEGIVGGEEGLL